MAATDLKEVTPPAVGAPTAKAPKKSAATKKKLATAPAHPKTYDMVLDAVKVLKDKKGSSLQAIKKYISTTYKVDGSKIANLIRRALKKAVTDGVLVQTKGTGASGSFKVAAAAGPTKEAKKKPTAGKKPAAAKKPKAAKTTPKKPKAKKLATTPKKAAKSPKKPKEAAAKKPKTVKKAKKSPSKPKAKKAAPKKQ